VCKHIVCKGLIFIDVFHSAYKAMGNCKIWSLHGDTEDSRSSALLTPHTVVVSTNILEDFTASIFRDVASRKAD